MGLALLLTGRVWAACGPIPGTYALSTGTKLDLKKDISINGITVGSGKTEPNAVLGIDGTIGTTSQTLPDLVPATFPANNSNTDANENDAPFVSSTDVYYDTIKIDTQGATVDFSGGGPFHINKLELKQDDIVLNLGAGTYFIDDLKLKGKNIVINITSEPVILNIGNKFQADADNITVNGGGSVTGLQVNLYAGAEFEAEKDNFNFTGLVYGPNADKVKFKKEATVRGAFIVGGEVKFEKNVTMTYTAADQAAVNALTTCPTSTGADHFVIGHDNAGINCLAEPVSVTAVDVAGNTVTDFANTITLDTGSGKGSWSLLTGNGTFTDATGNDGLATYAFVAADNGVATFNLDYQEGSSPINIAVSDGTVTDDDSEGTLAFSPSGFTVTANALSNPPPNPINDPITTQVAATSFSLHLAAYGQTASDPVCGIIENYTGNHSIKFWSTYDNPSTGTVQASINLVTIATSAAAATAQTINFTNGQAQVTANYSDVGRIQISLKDDTVVEPVTGISGASNLFVVKPARFLLSNILAPATAGNCGGGGTALDNPSTLDETATPVHPAGEDFCITVEAQNSDNLPTPNYGKESPAESVALTSTLFLPAGGNNPAILAPTGFGPFTNGSATGADFSWGEVGMISIQPDVADGDYLGGGAVNGSTAKLVGRFVPFDLNAIANTPQFGTSCGIFGYIGQPFTYTTAPVASITAVNKAGGTTLNYTGAFWKITDATLSGGVSYSTLTGQLDTGLILSPDPVISQTGNGAGTLTFSDGGGLSFIRNAPEVPFDAEIALQVTIADSDGVVWSGNPLGFGAPTAGNGIAFSVSKQQRWGRLTLNNAYGSELLSRNIPVVSEYFTANGFTINNDDNCTTYSAGNAILSAVAAPAGSTLTLADLAVSSPGADTPLINGRADPANPLQITAPGSGKGGSVDLSLNLSVGGADQLWLQYDWTNTDGLFDGPWDDNPAARAAFGVFSVQDQVIYTRELLN